MKNYILWISLFLGSLVGLLLLLRKFSKSSKNSQSPPKKIVPMALPMDKVFKNTKWEKMIPLMIAQQKHESNNFQSRVFKEQNNPFGMREAQKRSTSDLDDGTFVDVDGNIQLADKIGYSEYPNLLAASQDFKFYLESVNFEPTTDVEDFVFQLKSKNYFEDSYENYLRGVNFFLNK